MRISAAIITKVMYQPRQPTINRRAPPVYTSSVRFHDPCSITRKSRGEESYLLQIPRGVIVAGADLPIRATEHPRGDGDEEEDPGEDNVCLEREDEEGEQSEAPHDQV